MVIQPYCGIHQTAHHRWTHPGVGGVGSSRIHATRGRQLPLCRNAVGPTGESRRPFLASPDLNGRTNKPRMSGAFLKPTRGFERLTHSYEDAAAFVAGCGLSRRLPRTRHFRPFRPLGMCGWCRVVCCHPVATVDLAGAVRLPACNVP